MRASSSKIHPRTHELDASSTEFVLPDEIPIDPTHTLDQLGPRFGRVKDGLPELIKNSKDQYSRLGIRDREARQIVVIADTKTRELAVIDFAGARIDEFEGWTKWSSRTAGRSELSEDIEAGHGNGGKFFMVHGATDVGFLESCLNGKRTRMGFRNDRPDSRYKPGPALEDGLPVFDVDEPDPEGRLEEFLAELGLEPSELPSSALAAFRKRKAFTGVLLSHVAEWENRRKPTVKRLASMIPEQIAGHGQAAMSIETCEVWVIVDGELLTTKPITPIGLEPYKGFEEPVQYQIPDILPDPETGDLVDTVSGSAGPRVLTLCTSARQLQMSEETKPRNVIRVWNNRNNVANWPLHSLGVLLTSVSFIYGQLRCPALTGVHLAGAERVHLADTPLVRALEAWTRQKVQELAEDLHRAMMKAEKPRDREQAKSALEGIRNLMRQYLDPDAPGPNDDEDQSGERGKNGKGKKTKRKGAKYGDRIDQIHLEPGHSRIALAHGTSVPLRFSCVEVDSQSGKSKPVRSSNLRLGSTHPVVSLLAGGLIQADSVGATEIWLETEDGGVVSNRVPCEVVLATDVHVEVPDDTLLQGQRVKLPITFHTSAGPRDDILIDGSIDEPGMGLLGRHGRFVAGYREGVATVRVRFGPNPSNQRAAAVQVGAHRMPSPEGEGGHGSDVPEILLCGDEAPGMEEFPAEQRTIPGGDNFPTIIEDPLFPHVVWLNPQSKESVRVRRSYGGPSGVGSISSKSFMHFVALKCFDVLKRLHVRQALKGGTVTEFEFIQLAVFAEMECADFIDAAWEMSDQMLDKVDAKRTLTLEELA